MKHISTIKHKTRILNDISYEKVAKSYDCVCGKKYNHASSLWNHKQKCKYKTPQIDEYIPLQDDIQLPTIPTNIIMELIRQNQEFKQLMVEQNKQLFEKHEENIDLKKQLLEIAKNSQINNTINNTNNTNNSNNNNKTFNLQFFLNETCKNAMNMSEFIETIEVQMNELENIGHNGYVAGMTDIILSRIKDLDVSKRPVHCTDLKREIMYIKDQNEWNKDTAEKSYLRKAISMVSKKNCGKTMEWRERNPECLEIGSPKYDFCFKMMRNVLGDFEDVQIKLDNKIIKSLAKEVVVDR